MQAGERKSGIEHASFTREGWVSASRAQLCGDTELYQGGYEFDGGNEVREVLWSCERKGV